jgi:hypothetical protein
METTKKIPAGAFFRLIEDMAFPCFFGYYDVPAWDASATCHLVHRVPSWDRLPVSGDTAEIGIVDVRKKRFHFLTRTEAWNFQQGSMLQYHPLEDSKILFNRFTDGIYHGVIFDIANGKETEIEYPIANVDPKGRYSLSIDFHQIFSFRPGYGYPKKDRRFKDGYDREGDGIFLSDFATGKTTLIISYKKIEEFICQAGYDIQGKELVVNHITFNKNGSRFVFIARYIKDTSWVSFVITANTAGEDLWMLCDEIYASHYYWKDESRLLIYATCNKQTGLFELTDKTRDVELIDTGFFLDDGHCSYSPDGKWILYDSYPDQNNERNLYLYSLEKRKGCLLHSFYSDPRATGDIRCDLHPRWSPDGSAISFDSTHEGCRNLYMLDLRDGRIPEEMGILGV